MMLISEETICKTFGISSATLREWVDEGLVVESHIADRTGFEPSQVRRIWTIMSLQNDLDVNLQGIEIILDLAEQVKTLKLALFHAARRIEQMEQVDYFHTRILEELVGPLNREIDL